jgi:putative DNA primase/helicase
MSDAAALLDGALSYARYGIAVFPCDDDKAPRVKGGFHAATTDPKQIRQWWTQWPTAMIGLPTGLKSGIAVLDIDHKPEKGKDGFKVLPGWETMSSVIARTTSGGAHLYFRAHEEIRSTTDTLGHGIDTRGEGGYVIAPPSRGYVWEKGGPHLFSSLPEWPHHMRLPARAPTPNAEAEADPAEVAAAVNVIPNDDLGWDAWNRIAMAIFAATGGSDEGFEIFDKWSQKSAKYDFKETEKKWRHFMRSPPDKIGAGTLFHEATKAHPEWHREYDARLAAQLANNTGDFLADKLGEAAADAPPPTPSSAAAITSKKSKSKSPLGRNPSKAKQPASSRPVLDPTDVMEAARKLVRRQFTDDGQRTIHRHRGAFWTWSGGYYRLAGDEAVRARIWSFLDGALVPAKGNLTLPFKPNKSKVENVFAALCAESALDDHLEPPVWLNEEREKEYPAPELYACKGGLLHLPSKHLIPHTPSYFGIAASEVNFDPQAPAPERWLKFLDEAVGDKEAIATLQEAFGYTLSADTSQQKIILGVGPRRSGKGTCIYVLRKLIGHNSVTGPTMSDLSEPFGLQPLITSPLAVVSDARIGALTDKNRITERLLNISGEDVVTVNRKNRLQWTGKLPTRLWIMTNELPALADTSSALAGRFIIILFPTSFYGREDTRLKDKLDAEMTGILNWAIEGYRRLNERGQFRQPNNAMEIVSELETLGSPIRAFLRDECDVGAGYDVKGEALYEAYITWAKSNHQKEHNKEWFGRELRGAVPGLRHSRPRDKAGNPDARELHYNGVRLREKPM